MGFSNLLFASPSFLEGMGRSIDAAGVLTVFNESLTSEQADYLALQSDWRAVGSDIWKAIQAVHEQLPESERESEQEQAN